MTDQQTQKFQPDLYLDIDDVHAIKRRALDCHQSQKPDAIWEVHEAMHKRRGEECGVKRAEAYLLGGAKKGRPTLPVTFLSKKK